MSATPEPRIRLLNVGRLPAALLERLSQAYALTTLDWRPEARGDAVAYLQAGGAQFEALVTSAAAGADASLLERLPKLRVISNFGVGVDRIDVALAHSRGIPVGYTPEVLDDCVADIAFGLLLDVARGISTADRFVRRGDWPAGAFPLARKVSGARLGLVGMGRIGRTIAQRSLGFDMDVRYHSRRPVADLAWLHEPHLHELARWADFLVVIVAGGPTTRHLIDAGVLDALGPDGFLINVARGSVVDEAALVEALTERRIAGAGLDVFANEPQVPPALMALDNVVLLPHIASATRETRQAMADLAFDNLRSFFAAGRPVHAAPPV